MKTFLAVSKKAAIALTLLAALAAVITLTLALWSPIDGIHINIFDHDYDGASIASAGFFEWMALYGAITLAYLFAAVATAFALLVAVSAVLLALFFVAGALIVAALALLSPIIAAVAVVWLTVWAVRRLRAGASAGSGVVA